MTTTETVVEIKAKTETKMSIAEFRERLGLPKDASVTMSVFTSEGDKVRVIALDDVYSVFFNTVSEVGRSLTHDPNADPLQLVQNVLNLGKK